MKEDFKTVVSPSKKPILCKVHFSIKELMDFSSLVEQKLAVVKMILGLND